MTEPIPLADVRSQCPSSVAIGTFDGIHVGHQALIRSAVVSARSCRVRAVVLTFDRHPLETLDASRAPKMITTAAQKARLIGELGTDMLVEAPFDDRMRQMEAERFVADVLVGQLRAVLVHVGEGFRFGNGRRGTADLLVSLGRPLGLSVRVLPAVYVAGAPASSSRVRSMLEAGDVEGAALVLGRAFELTGTVVRGDQIGRQLGYPTANIECDRRQATPADGVYATRVVIRDRSYPGACSIGTRPTLGGVGRVIEVHLVGFDGDLYGQAITARFIRRLRGQERYASLDDLTAQIAEDVRATCSVVSAG